MMCWERYNVSRSWTIDNTGLGEPAEQTMEGAEMWPEEDYQRVNDPWVSPTGAFRPLRVLAGSSMVTDQRRESAAVKEMTRVKGALFEASSNVGAQLRHVLGGGTGSDAALPEGLHRREHTGVGREVGASGGVGCG